MPVSTAIGVDGLLDEPAWAAAPVSSGFRQRDPAEGDPATEATEVRVLYDEDTLYVGIVARDREPEKVIGRLLDRDKVMEQGPDNAARFTGDDVVAFTLDPFRDHRNAFFFATNPNGAEFDALVTDESPTLNVEWRGIWRVAAARTTEGWSAEFAIPFRTLRYPRVEGEQAWGFDVERIIRRRNEDTLWSAWSRAEGGLHRVSRAGRLEGLTHLPRSAWNVEVKPFGLAGATQQRNETGRAPASGEWRAGGDAKWEARPGLVLDATVRPDFAQVEADDQIVNLTRFEVFFPEKRDFFLENAGIFDFGTRGSYETPPFVMFFSRRIGIGGDFEVPVLGDCDSRVGSAGRPWGSSTSSPARHPASPAPTSASSGSSGTWASAATSGPWSPTGAPRGARVRTSAPTPRCGPPPASTSRASPRARRAATAHPTGPGGAPRSTRATRSTCTGSTCKSGRTRRPAWASSPAPT